MKTDAEEFLRIAQETYEGGDTTDGTELKSVSVSPVASNGSGSSTPRGKKALRPSTYGRHVRSLSGHIGLTPLKNLTVDHSLLSFFVQTLSKNEAIDSDAAESGNFGDNMHEKLKNTAKIDDTQISQYLSSVAFMHDTVKKVSKE